MACWSFRPFGAKLLINFSLFWSRYDADLTLIAWQKYLTWYSLLCQVMPKIKKKQRTKWHCSVSQGTLNIECFCDIIIIKSIEMCWYDSRVMIPLHLLNQSCCCFFYIFYTSREYVLSHKSLIGMSSSSSFCSLTGRTPYFSSEIKGIWVKISVGAARYIPFLILHFKYNIGLNNPPYDFKRYPMTIR